MSGARNVLVLRCECFFFFYVFVHDFVECSDFRTREIFFVVNWTLITFQNIFLPLKVTEEKLTKNCKKYGNVYGITIFDEMFGYFSL